MMSGNFVNSWIWTVMFVWFSLVLIFRVVFVDALFDLAIHLLYFIEDGLIGWVEIYRFGFFFNLDKCSLFLSLLYSIYFTADR